MSKLTGTIIKKYRDWKYKEFNLKKFNKIGKGEKIRHSRLVKMGKGNIINENFSVQGRGELNIKNYNLISWNCTILTQNHNYKKEFFNSQKLMEDTIQKK